MSSLKKEEEKNPQKQTERDHGQARSNVVMIKYNDE